MVKPTNDDSNPFRQLPFHLYDEKYYSIQNIVSYSLVSRWKTDPNPIKRKNDYVGSMATR